ncbi:hypothetical protein L0U85_02530 [Glycomyces sp. L485]|uniref:hypothetical protein n=1 Tax=Glycomyces sp. L485 TaxID=2909235 RepID=UPI001F4AD13A|nr:hypothetical protein [Glycomyces sp. L485]MCH7229740.1 hypothetical protein [Glycomyces sp. L485]
MRIGITGHMNLTAATVDLVAAALKHELSRYDPAELVGVSCLAEGADAIFAQTVLDAGGRLEALLPAPDYRDTRVSQAHLPVFDTLVAQAHTTRYVAEASSMQAYDQANAAMLDSVDRMLAVWDGQPSPSWKTGGTADAVTAARSRGVPITVIWPEGAERG